MDLKFRKYGSGICQKCHNSSDDLYETILSAERGESTCILCRECALNLKYQIEKSNTSNGINNSPPARAPQKRFCGKCGAELEDGSMFCGKCGFRITEEPAAVPAAAPVFAAKNTASDDRPVRKTKPSGKKINKKTLIIILVLVVLAVTAAILTPFFIKQYRRSHLSEQDYISDAYKNFNIEGQWKNVGDTTCAQIQRNSTVTFDGVHCNVYSPSDTYLFYESDGEYHLDCTSPFAGDSLCFTVTVIDSDNIQLHSSSTTVSLCRVGGTPVVSSYDSGYSSDSYGYNNNSYGYDNTTQSYSGQHSYQVISADVSWFEAKSECELKGGHLATITSQREYDEICRLAESSGLKYIWLGARIYSVSDSFDEWITGESMNFTKWYPGEPSKADVDGTEEFYLCLWNVNYNGNEMGWTFNDQRNDLMSDESVKSGSVGYVIEYDY